MNDVTTVASPVFSLTHLTRLSCIIFKCIETKYQGLLSFNFNSLVNFFHQEFEKKYQKWMSITAQNSVNCAKIGSKAYVCNNCLWISHKMLRLFYLPAMMYAFELPIAHWNVKKRLSSLWVFSLQIKQTNKQTKKRKQTITSQKLPIPLTR